MQGKLLEDIKIKQFLLVLLNDTLLTILKLRTDQEDVELEVHEM